MSRSALPYVIATAFFAAHIAWLPPTPTGVDAANFVLGVREFKVADHQPHPPGYPVFIALGKASSALLESLPTPRDVEPTRRETRAVALWSVIFGALAVFALRLLYRELKADENRALAAAALTVTCPLFWFNGSRAMSDVSGLTAAVVAQALALSAYWRSQALDPSATRRLIAAAFVTGLAIGVRSQVVWLALPLMAFVMVGHARRAGHRHAIMAGAALIAGALLWAVPLVAAGGGPAAYLGAIGGQARDDVGSGTMLAIRADPGAALDALVRTFAYPWAQKNLAAAMLGLASIGALSLLFQRQRSMLFVAIGFGPYALYHLLLQDTEFVRYALPLVPAVSFLAIAGLDRLAPRLVLLAVVTLAVASLSLAIPPAIRHAQNGSPSLRALEDVRARWRQTDRPPVLAMHHAVSRILRLETLPGPALAAPSQREWLELVEYWRNGGTAPVWFLAEPERTDLALIDARARRLMNRYRLPVDQRFFLSGVRPSGIDWYEFDRPSWFAAEGWALSPETGGVAAAANRGPAVGPVTAYVRRRTERAVVVVGGRHLQNSPTSARFEMSVDGRVIDGWTVGPAPGSFLRITPLPSQLLRPPPVGATSYAVLQIRSTAADDSDALVRTSIEQFDVQSERTVAFGFAEGWFEQEVDRKALRRWRWMGPNASLRIHHGGHDVFLHAVGEAPTAALDGPATVLVRAGNEIVGRFAFAGNFEWRLRVPAALLDRSEGQLQLESDRSFVPRVAFGTSDDRTLALRVYELEVEPSPTVAEASTADDSRVPISSRKNYPMLR